MAIWAMGVMVAPILGPTLGGWLTEMISWRWTFYINLPVGIVSFLLALRYVPDTATRERRMDWLGFASLALGIGALQLFLDRGNEEDWFSSDTIIVAAITAVVSFIFFIVYTITGKHHPLFDLRLFKDRNFLVASLIMTTIGVGFFGGMLLQSLYLQNFLGYPTFEAGIYMAPRGLASLIVMIFVGKYSGKVPPRNFVLVGIACSIAGNYLMTGYTGDITAHELIVPMILQGFGMGLIFVPISTLAFTTLPKELAAEAAGIYSLIRTVGSALGISVLATYFSRSTQQNWGILRGEITPYSDALHAYLAPLHLGTQDAQGIALAAKEVMRQAQNVAYIDSFWFATLNFVLMLPLILLVRTPARGASPPAHVSAE
jgi:DHA2 family multidrug resistance protein